MVDESPRLNPSTGISNFVRPEKKQSEVLRSLDEMREQMLNEREKAVERKEVSNIPKFVYQPSQAIKQTKSVAKVSRFSSLSFLIPSKTKRSTSDQLKILRFQNKLEKLRLQNQIDRMKIAKKSAQLKGQTIFKQAVGQPINRGLTYPAYADSTQMADIDSAFFADINHAEKSLWGNEQYFGEQFYNEDFYGTEFNNSPFDHLQLKPQRGVSPLLW